MPGKISLEQLEAIAASLGGAAKPIDADDPAAEYPSIAVAPSSADELLGADFSMYARAEAEHSAYINALTVNNPIAIVVPCHRVIRESGALGGYRWGLERKRTLLDIERAAR